MTNPVTLSGCPYDPDVQWMCGYFGFGWGHEVVLTQNQSWLSPSHKGEIKVMEDSSLLSGTYARPYHTTRLWKLVLRVTALKETFVLGCYYHKIEDWGGILRCDWQTIKEAQRAWAEQNKGQ
jgi:hypothetical protein